MRGGLIPQGTLYRWGQRAAAGKGLFAQDPSPPPQLASASSPYLSAVNISPRPPSDVEIIDMLRQAGIESYCLVADSVLATMDQYLADLAAEGRVSRWVVPSERSIPAVAAGRWLATGELTLMAMQNSGFSNAMDYLRTVMRVHAIPGLVLAGWRGHDQQRDESEPHLLVGDMTDGDAHTTMGSEHVFGHRDGTDLMRETHRAIADALSGSLAYLRLSPDGFVRTQVLRPISNDRIPYPDPARIAACMERKGRPFQVVMQGPLLSRDEALHSIHEEMAVHEPFYIVGNGYNPRAMQALRITADTFENAGGMGSGLAMGWGAARSDPDQVFVVIDGDQNAVMNEMEKVLVHDYPENLFWYILNNGSGESVGNSTSIPLAPWHYQLARVINTTNGTPGTFSYPRVNASGLKFEAAGARALAARIGNLPAQAHLARRILEHRRAGRHARATQGMTIGMSKDPSTQRIP